MLREPSPGNQPAPSVTEAATCGGSLGDGVKVGVQHPASRRTSHQNVFVKPMSIENVLVVWHLKPAATTAIAPASVSSNVNTSVASRTLHPGGIMRVAAFIACE